jgi:serine/threonine protein phosphatase 1
MFNWLKTKPDSSGQTTPPTLPDGERIYAIGDIHGRRDLLDRLITLIEADLVDYKGESRLVFLGDYIDRGPDSKGVLERMMGPLPGTLPPVFLLGNHEESFLAFFTDISVGNGWLTHGGLNTLLSYGIPFKGGSPTLQLQSDIVANFPETHRNFLAGMPTWFICGDYYFVHAGVNPTIPLDQQSDGDRLWIRHGFMSWKTPLEKMIVHGHTISDTVDVHAYRIGVDTGAYASGRLTALVLEGPQRRTLQT